MSFLYPSYELFLFRQGSFKHFYFPFLELEEDGVKTFSSLLFSPELRFPRSAADTPVSTVSNCIFIRIALHSAVIVS